MIRILKSGHVDFKSYVEIRSLGNLMQYLQIKLPIFFNQKYNNYVSLPIPEDFKSKEDGIKRKVGITYRIKPLIGRLPLIVESLKPLFGLKQPKCTILSIKGKRYLGYHVSRSKEGRIIEAIPYHIFLKDYVTLRQVLEDDEYQDFRSHLRSIYFFRYLLGFRTINSSLAVTEIDGELVPISISETRLSKKIPRSGSGFKISPSNYEPETTNLPEFLYINPQDELRKILGLSYNERLSLDKLHEFLNRLRLHIQNIDAEYSWLVIEIQRLILELVEFDDD